MRFKASRVSSLWKERRKLVKVTAFYIPFCLKFQSFELPRLFYLITEPLSDSLSVFVGAKVL